MSIKKFRLVSQYLVPRDAVSKHVLELRSLLVAMGHIVQVHTMVSAPEYQAITKPIDLLHEAANDELIIYQYSIWDQHLSTVLRLQNKKMVYYHGITPPSMLRGLMPGTAEDCTKGLDALPLLEAFDWVVTNSDFNLREIQQHFFPKHFDILPPYLTNDLLSAHLPDSNYDPNQIIYVGRFYPHKNIEKVISVFSELKKLNDSYHLTLAGSGVLSVYLSRLMQIIGDRNDIKFQFNLSANELAALYKSSLALFNFSKHEGFGMPFVEAFGFDTPVVSHSYAAIPETLQGAGILIEDHFDKKDIEALHRLLQFERESILVQQRKIFELYFSEAVVTQKYIDFLERFIND